MRIGYVICTAPRAGSTLLAEALEATGRAGRPKEYFDVHERNEQYWIRTLGIESDADYIPKVIEAGLTPNGVFGLKLHWYQLPAFYEKLTARLGAKGTDGSPASIDRLISDCFGDHRYIWLLRRNKIAEGISYYRAAKTDIWYKHSGGAARSDFVDKRLAFDYVEIDRHIRFIEEFNLAWEAYFRQGRLKVMVLYYEDFVMQYETTIRAVLEYLGIEHKDLSIVSPRLERQADARSLEWERQYVEMQQSQSASAGQRITPPDVHSKKRKRTSLKTIARAAPANAGNESLPFIAYSVDQSLGMRLEPARSDREWMDATPHRFAYRCLPLLIANQAGWIIKNPEKIMVIWNGGPGPDALKVEYFGMPRVRPASSHFGCGILTFTIDFLFKTPRGYNLYVRGPANMPKDGIAALEGIIETDWSEATFTMNWQVTRRNHPIMFEQGEPIAMFSPIKRGELERFRPEIRSITENPDLKAGFDTWARSREQHNAGLNISNSEAQKREWQRHYLRGVTATDRDAPEHQTSLKLEPFVDKRE